ncbi:MAG: hypothetical protein CMM61_08515 [Rhodospirillaceae bacterium]|nr:hypothetical protein [Rhodospirillaceae bacterium]|tara:strand:- start:959 stop:1195 length:237 start_codon:yes stop_codon:yes gene_type:complete
MNEQLKSTSIERLKGMIENTEQQLAYLKDELQERENQAAHEQIEHLDDYMDVAEQRFGPLIEFVATIMKELRNTKSKG